MMAHPERPLVANLRPADQAPELTHALRQLSFEVLEAPALRVEPTYDLAEMAAARDALVGRAVEWAVFASANAVRSFGQGLADVGGSLALLAGCQVLAGAATAAVLRQAGVSVARVLDRFSAQAALEMLLAAGVRGPVLAPRAAEGRDELLLGLRAAGVEVSAPVVYRTRPATPTELAPLLQALTNGQVAAITLTSPSAVRALLAVISANRLDPIAMLKPVSLVCLGETTAAETRSRGLAVAAIARQTSATALAAAVQAALSQRGGVRSGVTTTEVRA